MAKVLRALLSHMVLCIVCVATLIVTFATLAIATGGVYAEQGVPERMYYGDTLSYSARGILSSVKYEYGYIDEQGQVSWSSEQPEYPGTYRLRTVSRSLFGSTRHVKEYEYVIEPLPLEVAAIGEAFEWGDEISVQAPTVNGDQLTEYSLIREDLEGDQVDISADPNSIVIRSKTGEDVTYAYAISTPNKRMQVFPRAMTVTVADKTFMYDGREKALEGAFDGYTITAGSLRKEDTLQADCSVKLTDCGSEEILPRLQVLSSDGRDVTEYYKFTIEPGHLIVTPRPLELLTESRERVYDGMAVTHDGYEMAEGALPLVNGHRIEGDFLVLTDVVEGLPNNPAFHVLDEQGREVTANYAISVTPGVLAVMPRPITITTEGGTWVYDGTEYALPSVVIGGDGLVSGQDLKDRTTPVLRNVARVVNACADTTILDADGNDVTANYAITTQYGTLEITPRPITITTEGGTWVYDSTEYALPGHTIGGEYGLVEGHTIPDNEQPSLRNVGSLLNRREIAVLDANGQDVTSNYEIATQYGTLEVTPRHLSISTESGTWLYDGMEHSLPQVTYGEDGLAPNQRLADDTTPVLVNVALVVNACADTTIRDAEGNDVTSNYIVTINFGTLEVTPRHLSISTESGTWLYDGMEHSLPQVTYGEDGLAPNQRLMNESTPVVRKVGTVANACKNDDIRDARGANVTSNYIITTDYGTLEIVGDPDDPDDNFDANGDLEDTGAEEDLLVGYITASTSGTLYLRQTSFGNYTGNGWEDPIEYGKTLPGGLSYNYLTAIALENAGRLKRQTAVFSDMKAFMIPYFPRVEEGDGYPLLTEDGYYDSSLTDYRVSYFNTMFYDWSSLRNMLAEYAPYEEEYRRFVYENYLALDSETEAYIRGFIAENGLDASDPDIILKVAHCIQHSATYNLAYDKAMDGEENIIVAFLSTYREGVCRHYASSATAVYRALGIPARYTVGFMLEVAADRKTEIRTPGHAWVEVYLDGIGWIPVEVTGGSTRPEPIEVELTPLFAHKEYDGTPLYAPNALDESGMLAELLKMGYTYTVAVSGQQTEVGDSVTYIEKFHLYDPSGKDVTENGQFKFVYNTGSIRVIHTALYIFPYQVSKYYDGKSATFSTECAILTGPDGVEVRLIPLVEFTSVAQIKVSDMNNKLEEYFSWKVFVNGVDQTDAFTPIFILPEWMGSGDYIPFEIKQRQIELTSASCTKVDDGKELTAPEVTVSKGTLAEGDVLYAEAIGSLDEVGECENRIGIVRIYNALGEDVTSSYDIQKKPGKLCVIEAPDEQQ